MVISLGLAMLVVMLPSGAVAKEIVPVHLLCCALHWEQDMTLRNRHLRSLALRCKHIDSLQFGSGNGVLCIQNNLVYTCALRLEGFE